MVMMMMMILFVLRHILQVPSCFIYFLINICHLQFLSHAASSVVFSQLLFVYEFLKLEDSCVCGSPVLQYVISQKGKQYLSPCLCTLLEPYYIPSLLTLQLCIIPGFAGHELEGAERAGSSVGQRQLCTSSIRRQRLSVFS